MDVTRTQVLKYTLLPGFIPRLFTLFGSGFANIAYLMASIYASLRLLPPGHPYLQPTNFGKFGMRHVIAEAANNLVFKKENIDQIILFFTLLAGFLLIIAQFGLMLFALLTLQPALAQNPEDILLTNSIYNAGPGQDIALKILDRVFGVTGIFGSCISDAAIACVDRMGNPLPEETFPYPFHIALHALFQFFSYGIFMVSVFVIIYYVISIVGQAAATGTPIAQGYNKTWIVPRLILFLALIVPLNVGQANGGLNAAQIITLWTAKIGSNFATNGWGRFNESLSDTYLGQANNLIAEPNIPELSELIRAVFVAKTCKIAEEYAYDKDPLGVQAYIVRENQPFGLDTTAVNALEFETASFERAIRFSNYGNITIRFGSYNETDYQSYKGYVMPYCGQIVMNVLDIDPDGNMDSGAAQIQAFYYDILKDLWMDRSITQRATCVVQRTINDGHNPNCRPLPTKEFAEDLSTQYHERMRNTIPRLIALQIQEGEWSVPASLREKGWAGAAIWYNRIAEMNGAVTSAVLNIPQVNRYPFVLEIIGYYRQRTNESTDDKNKFDPVLAQGEDINFPRVKDLEIAGPMYSAYKFWEEDGMGEPDLKPLSGNVLIDAINMIFGTSGIFDMRENTDIHPLAQLSALGKGMMDATVRNVGLGLGGSGLAKILGNQSSAKTVSDVLGTFLLSMGLAVISISFILYFVLPFMPFIYFIFAVSGWVKSIFEAMVAMPLWAMAHLRIDGEGLIGPGASNGYFLLFEIFLRPILIVVGLVASITIFAGLVKILNDVFDLAVSNTAGFNQRAEIEGTGTESLSDFMRGPVDEFFFTAMYAIIVYIIGLSCFKLIDQIPNQILRWAGMAIPTFQENAGDPVQDITQRTYQGILLTSGQVRGDKGKLAAILGPGSK